ncbi:tyrosine-type recombinase/integrase [Pectobacterium polaris]|uniref:tyrosine-type recombinase/integrase n=1 Tax=Pectobacterium polaris TaxID=2042057 RepID=UPI0015813D96|nr:tyrosine-type recombinase/integrase [Pectobacterium polaris]
MVKIGVSKFFLDSGERYCIVINKETGIPLYYPNLYLTTQFRNRAYSVSSIESIAINISLFYRFIENRNISIEECFLSKKYLSGADIDRLAIFLSEKSYLKKNKNIKNINVSKKTLYIRLNNIADYLSWLAEEFLQYTFSKYEECFSKMIKNIKGRRPKCKNKKHDRTNEGETLSDEAVEMIMRAINPLSPSNPFEYYVRKRNEILIIILLELGIRCGELLNIKIEDINFQRKRLFIKRRADEKSDPRLNQPLVKTHGRALALSDGLAYKLLDYIVYDRKLYVTGETDYLFISYKSGPYQGSPLTIFGYQKIISKIRLSNPLFNKLRGHQFRHIWNYNFSKLMDSQHEKVSETEQEQIRNETMGWDPDSETGAIYNKRYIREKTDEASIRLQEKLFSRYMEKGNDKRNKP